MKFKIPHTYVLLFILIVIVAVLTHVIPAGVYDRAEDPETGRIFVVPDSYHEVERSPVGFFGIFKAIPTAMTEVGYIIFFVLLIGGAFGMINGTGAINAGIGSIVQKSSGSGKVMIPVVMFVFSLAGAILGSAEEMLPFYPIIISLALALGFDSIVGTALVLVGAGAGFAGAFLNPFTIGIAQGISGLPYPSGAWLRLIAYAVLLIASIIYVYRYAVKIKADPTLSVTYHQDKNHDHRIDINELEDFTTKHKIVLVTFLLGLIVLAYGVVQLGWYITELSAIFLIIGVACGLIGGTRPSKLAENFIDGAREMTYGALIIGIASTIMVIMREGNIMDTIIYSLANVVSSLPGFLSAIGMFIVQSLINLFIPSGSGQAAASMPIMAPLSDAIGLTRQTAVLAFQFGDGFTNVISPTSGYFMAALAIGGIKWEDWAKWFFPLFMIWNAIAILFLSFAAIIGYGPF